MPEYSSRMSSWTNRIQCRRVSQTARLRKWQNVYRLFGAGEGGGTSKCWVDRLVVSVVEKPDRRA